MPRAPRRCAECDDYALPGKSRCASHHRAMLRRHRSPSSLAHDKSRERARRAAVVRAWVTEHGWICPGWERDRHPARDLTAAHDQAVALGGDSSDLTVLCRTCNSRQGTRATTPPPAG